VRDTEGLVRRIMNPKTADPAAPAAAAQDPDIQRLESEIADKLGAKVAFQHAASGKGKLIVSYNSLDELEGILAHIQ
jgi:ParB family chromosome partitioning protein